MGLSRPELSHINDVTFGEIDFEPSYSGRHIYIYAFGQIQVLIELESSIFGEVHDIFSRIYEIGKRFFMIL